MATTSFYALFESASGYGLFSILETEEIGAFLEEVRFNDALAFADMRRNLFSITIAATQFLICFYLSGTDWNY